MVRMSERGYKDVSVRVELIGMSRGYASLELKPIPGEAPPEFPKQESGDTVSVLDLSIPENARQEFEKGQGALKENKLDDGVAHLRKAIKLYEAFPQAYTLLGTAYLEQKNWKNAEMALRKANELDPKFPDAYLELGAVLNQTKEYPQAETALLKGLELKPEAAGGHYELAKTYWAQGRWKDAAPHARQAVAGMPDLAPAHALLGNVMLRESNAVLAAGPEWLNGPGCSPNDRENPESPASLENNPGYSFYSLWVIARTFTSIPRAPPVIPRRSRAYVRMSCISVGRLYAALNYNELVRGGGHFRLQSVGARAAQRSDADRRRNRRPLRLQPLPVDALWTENARGPLLFLDRHRAHHVRPDRDCLRRLSRVEGRPPQSR